MRNDEINMIEKTMAELNRTVIGAVYIDYPIYIIHLEYKKRNDDPMFYIDWAIMHFINNQPKLDTMSVAKIIGLDYRLILYRIKKLKDDGLVNEDLEGFCITNSGRQLFFENLDERPYINASSDLLIDGRDLTIMPEIFYKNRGYINFEENSIYPRKIIKGPNTPVVNKILDSLEKMPYEKKSAIGLPAYSKNFTSINAPSQGLLRIYLVFSCDDNNQNYKDLVYEGQIVDIPSVKEIIDKSYFRDNLEFNYGYDKSDVDQLRNKVFAFTINGIKELLKGMFFWEQVSERWFKYDKNSILRPLTLNINLENFKKSSNRRLLINNMTQGYTEINDKEKFIRITVETQDKELKKLLDLDKDIEKSKIVSNLTNIDSIKSTYGEPYVRQGLIVLDRLEYLEEIDTYKYILQ